MKLVPTATHSQHFLVLCKYMETLVICLRMNCAVLILLFPFALCSGGNRGGGGDFVAGFLLGGAVFGTLAYVFAPQVSLHFLVFLLFIFCS